MADAEWMWGGAMEDVKDENEERQGKQGVGAEGVTEPGASMTLKER